MKKIFALLLAVQLLFALPLVAMGDDASLTFSGTCGENLAWEVTDGGKTLTIKGYGEMTDFMSSFTVPWADHRTKITSVVFVEDGGNILSISDYAMHGLNMTAIELPEKLQRIGTFAFSYSDIASIILPDTLQSIGTYAFSSCDNLTSVNLPSSLTGIGFSVFSHCSKLRSVVLQDGIASVPDSAFSYCSTLESIAIPVTVTQIGASAFNSCSKLESVEFSGTISQAKAITIGYSNTEVKEALWMCDDGDMYQDLAFNGSCGENLSWKVSEDRSALTITGCGEMTDYAISAKVPWADHQTKITSVTFVEEGGDILSIGKYALYGLNMAAVELPEKLKRIGNVAFADCDSLTLIDLPDTLQSIGAQAFHCCDNLASISLPGSLTSIGNTVFSFCPKLSSVVLQDGIVTIPDSAFSYCSALETVTLPLSVAKINEDAFDNCNSIKDVYYDGALEDALKIDFATSNVDLKEAVWHYKKTGLSDNPQDGDIVEDGKLPDKPVTGPVLVVDQYGTIQGADIKYDKTNGNQGGNNKKNTVTYNVHLLDPQGYGLDLPELQDGEKYTLIFPYPEGLNQNSPNKYRIIIHHYASGTLNNLKDPNKPEIFKSEDGEIEFLPQGIAVKISSFSPFVISWESKTPTFDLTVVKEWDVPEGVELPESILVNLYANGKAINEAQLTAETNWTYTWEELPAKDDDDIQIEYSVSEVEIAGYVSSIGDPVETDTGIEIAITNTFAPVKTDLPKTGDDSSMALWICLLGMTGAAMMMLKKRAQN